MSWHTKSTDGYELGSTEANDNANEVASIFSSGGYSTLAIAAICGAFQQECSMNPWQWENNVIQYSNNISNSVGYGLPQFTPATEYINHANTFGDIDIDNNYAPNFRNVAGGVNDGAAQCYFIMRHHIETSDGWLPTVGERYQSILSNYISNSDAYAATHMTINNFKTGLDDSNNPYSIDAMIGAFVASYLRPSESDVAQYFGSTYLTYARWYKSYFDATPIDPSTAFVPRLTSDGIRYSKWWYSNGNIFYASGYGLDVNNGNCTCYAYGRWGEIRNAFANLPSGDAGTWWDNVTGFEKGSTPRLGAIACYHDPNGIRLGHVSIVEVIEGDNIKTSNSGWGGPFFWVAENLNPSNGYRQQWQIDYGYVLQGFIYLDKYIPPTPPPTPSLQTGVHHIKPYFYINILRRK